jgi:hypothetical protein
MPPAGADDFVESLRKRLTVAIVFAIVTIGPEEKQVPMLT